MIIVWQEEVSRGAMGVKRAREANGGRNFSRQVLASSLFCTSL